MADVKLGDVPSSALNDTGNVIFCDGENVRKETYGNMKADIVGTATLATGSQKPKESINEIVQDILDTGGYGIISGGIVSAQSTSNMTVQVTECPLRTQTGARQTATANASVAVTTSDTTNARIDIVYVNSSGTISYLQGTASATPISPATPTEGLLLAEIYVSANSTTITNANITDKREMLVSTDMLNEQLSDMALYGATCSYASNVFTLTLANAPTTLPNFYSIRFKAPSIWVEGSTFKIGTKTYTPVNANFSANDVVIMNFDEISGKCFSTGSPKTVLPSNLVYATTASINYYVATTGNDITGDGTSGNPFKTIQKALDSLPKIINHTIVIYITNGTYDESVNITGFLGQGTITLRGNGSTVTQITVQNNFAYIVIDNFTVTITTTHAITIISCFYVDIKNCICITASASFSGVYASNGGTCCVGTSTISNKSICLYANWGATIISATNSGTNNTTVLRAYYGGTIDKASTQPSGTTAELASYGGVIR